MKRGVGVSVVKNKKIESEKFELIGKKMHESKMSAVREVLTKFQTSLTEFAEKHKKRINSDPEFRQQFHKMCVSVGVDPLTSNKGFWADILGVGDFYFELGIVITQICLQTRSINGGIISLPNLLERVKTHRNKNKLKKQEEVSIEDLKRAIDKLSVLGSGFKLVESKGKIPYLLSVPIELNRDHEEIIEVAEEIGYVSSEVMSRERGWTAERFNHTINPLLLEGLVWEDNYLGVRSYYFPTSINMNSKV